MKKSLLFLLLVLGFIPTICNAQELPPLSFRIKNVAIIGDDLGNGTNVRPRTPIHVPSVALDEHTLYSYSECEGCTVQLLDESENVVFADSIAENQTSLVLPSDLSGTYELQIIKGDYIFYCEIEL